MEYVQDDNGNRCNIEYWGSEAAARKALESLRGCTNCTDCSGCTDCSDCTRCQNCYGCHRCWGCSACTTCAKCFGSSKCIDCWDCTGCSGCVACKTCSGAASCSYTLASINDACRYGRWEALGPVKIPAIPDIHRAVYARAMGAPERSRAECVVHLAGAQGFELYLDFGQSMAAYLIYKASAPDRPVLPSKFFMDSEHEREDMRRMAQGPETAP